MLKPALIAISVACMLLISTDPVCAIDKQRAQELITQGRKLRLEGRIKDGAQLFEQALKADPDSVDALILYGQTWCEREQEKKANEFFERAYSLDPHNPTCQFWMAIALLRKKQETRARDLLEAMLKKSPQEVKGYVWLGKTYAALSNNDQATGQLLQFVEKTASSSKKYAYAGMAAFYATLGKNKKAAEFYRKALTIDEHYATALRALADYYVNLSQLDKARELLKRACASSVIMDDYFVQARLSRLENQPEAALRYLDKAMVTQPNGSMDVLYLTKTDIYISEKKYRQAFDCVEKSIQLNGPTFTKYQKCVQLCFLEQQPGKALEFIEKLVAIADDARKLAVTGELFLQSAKADQAVKLLDRAITQDSTSARSYVLRAHAYYKLNQNEKTIRDCTEAIKLDPSMAEAYVYRSLALRDIGKIDEAIADLEAHLKYQEDSLTFRRLIDLHLRRGAGEPALPLAERAVKLFPAEGELHAQKAEIHTRLKQRTEAIKEWTETLKRLPDADQYWMARASAYADKDRLFEALVDATEAIRRSPRSAYYVFRGDCFFRQKRERLAIQDWTRALACVDVEKPNSYLYLKRADSYANLKEYELAIADYTQILARKANPKILYLRAKMYEALKKNELALADLKAAARLAPGDSRLTTAEGRVHVAMHDYAAAIAAFDRSIKLDPSDPGVWNLRSGVYEKLGKTAEAVRDRQKAEELQIIPD